MESTVQIAKSKMTGSIDHMSFILTAHFKSKLDGLMNIVQNCSSLDDVQNARQRFDSYFSDVEKYFNTEKLSFNEQLKIILGESRDSSFSDLKNELKKETNLPGPSNEKSNLPKSDKPADESNNLPESSVGVFNSRSVSNNSGKQVNEMDPVSKKVNDWLSSASERSLDNRTNHLNDGPILNSNPSENVLPLVPAADRKNGRQRNSLVPAARSEVDNSQKVIKWVNRSAESDSSSADISNDDEAQASIDGEKAVSDDQDASTDDEKASTDDETALNDGNTPSSDDSPSNNDDAASNDQNTGVRINKIDGDRISEVGKTAKSESHNLNPNLQSGKENSQDLTNNNNVSSEKHVGKTVPDEIPIIELSSSDESEEIVTKPKRRPSRIPSSSDTNESSNENKVTEVIDLTESSSSESTTPVQSPRRNMKSSSNARKQKTETPAPKPSTGNAEKQRGGTSDGTLETTNGSFKSLSNTSTPINSRKVNKAKENLLESSCSSDNGTSADSVATILTSRTRKLKKKRKKQDPNKRAPLSDDDDTEAETNRLLNLNSLRKRKRVIRSSGSSSENKSVASSDDVNARKKKQKKVITDEPDHFSVSENSAPEMEEVRVFAPNRDSNYNSDDIYKEALGADSASSNDDRPPSPEVTKRSRTSATKGSGNGVEEVEMNRKKRRFDPLLHERFQISESDSELEERLSEDRESRRKKRKVLRSGCHSMSEEESTESSLNQTVSKEPVNHVPSSQEFIEISEDDPDRTITSDQEIPLTAEENGAVDDHEIPSMATENGATSPTHDRTIVSDQIPSTAAGNVGQSLTDDSTVVTDQQIPSTATGNVGQSLPGDSTVVTDEQIPSTSAVNVAQSLPQPPEPNKIIGRKNIRPLQESTLQYKKAAAEEKERQKRIKEKESLIKQTAPEVDKLVLDFDKTTKQPLVSVDPGLTAVLEDHQKEGVKFMWNCCFESVEQVKTSSGSGCILAHCMGLGKSLQVVTLAHTIINHPELNLRTILIVCPKSVTLNWNSEFQTWENKAEASSQRVKIFDLINCKSIPDRARRLRNWQNLGGVMLMGYDVFALLVLPRRIPESLQNSHHSIKNYLVDPGPDIVVFDEGHLLKNDLTNRNKAANLLKTKRRIILTGTPMQNNLMEYYFMVNFVKPNILGNKREFCNRFLNPIENGQYQDSTSNDVKRMKERTYVLCRKLDGFVQRFESNVFENKLPERQEYVLKLRMSALQINLYKNFVESIQRNAQDTQEIERTFMKSEKTLSLICAHPKIFTNADDAEPSAATAPTEKALNAEADLKKCLEGINLDDISHSSKTILFFEILKKCAEYGDKLLVFSQSLKTLDLLESFLKNESNGIAGSWSPGTDYFRLDGATDQTLRKHYCDEFNSFSNKRARLFLLSTNAGGLGLNLIGANRAIIFDVSWNPSMDSQSAYRIYRFGQTKPCYIYRFIMKGTLEEKKYHRQVKKLSTSSRVVDKRQVGRHFQENDLRTLFKHDFDYQNTRSFPNGKQTKDEVLSALLSNFDCIDGFEEHDALLMNIQGEELSVEDQQQAMDNYERERIAANEPTPSKNPQPQRPSNLEKRPVPQLNRQLVEEMVQYYCNQGKQSLAAASPKMPSSLLKMIGGLQPFNITYNKEKPYRPLSPPPPPPFHLFDLYKGNSPSSTNNTVEEAASSAPDNHRPLNTHNTIEETASSTAVNHRPSSTHNAVEETASSAAVIHRPSNTHNTIEEKASSAAINHRPSNTNNTVEKTASSVTVNHPLAKESTPSTSVPVVNNGLFDQPCASTGVQFTANCHEIHCTETSESSLHKKQQCEKENMLSENLQRTFIIEQRTASKIIDEQVVKLTFSPVHLHLDIPADSEKADQQPSKEDIQKDSQENPRQNFIVETSATSNFQKQQKENHPEEISKENKRHLKDDESKGKVIKKIYGPTTSSTKKNGPMDITNSTQNAGKLGCGLSTGGPTDITNSTQNSEQLGSDSGNDIGGPNNTPNSSQDSNVSEAISDIPRSFSTPEPTDESADESTDETESATEERTDLQSVIENLKIFVKSQRNGEHDES